jgi:hypothetical protein
MPSSVKAAALKAGLYVVTQTGDTVKIDIPEGFKPKEWQDMVRMVRVRETERSAGT